MIHCKHRCERKRERREVRTNKCDEALKKNGGNLKWTADSVCDTDVAAGQNLLLTLCPPSPPLKCKAVESFSAQETATCPPSHTHDVQKHTVTH